MKIRHLLASQEWVEWTRFEETTCIFLMEGCSWWILAICRVSVLDIGRRDHGLEYKQSARQFGLTNFQRFVLAIAGSWASSAAFLHPLLCTWLFLQKAVFVAVPIKPITAICFLALTLTFIRIFCYTIVIIWAFFIQGIPNLQHIILNTGWKDEGKLLAPSSSGQ